MGQKTHPVGFRLGGIKTWDSRWYAKREYATLLKEDIFIRRYVKKIIESRLEGLRVYSYQELGNQVELRPLGRVAA